MKRKAMQVQQLLKVSNDLKRFSINKDAIEVIRALEGEIAVVAMCGSKGSGKSWLLNQVL
jgi:ABC-type lipoprotein export system ATPase subunit